MGRWWVVAIRRLGRKSSRCTIRPMLERFSASSLVLVSVLVCATRTVMCISRRLPNALSCGFGGLLLPMRLALALFSAEGIRSTLSKEFARMRRASGAVPRGHLGDVHAKPLEQRSRHAGLSLTPGRIPTESCRRGCVCSICARCTWLNRSGPGCRASLRPSSTRVLLCQVLASLLDRKLAHIITATRAGRKQK